MSNPKGTRFERDAVIVARQEGWPDADRVPRKGARDEGDLDVFPDVTIEAKDRKQLGVAGALDEAAEEARNAGRPWHAALIKRRGRNAAHAYYVQPWGQACRRERAHADALDELARLRGEVRVLEKALRLVGGRQV